MFNEHVIPTNLPFGVIAINFFMQLLHLSLGNRQSINELNDMKELEEQRGKFIVELCVCMLYFIRNVSVNFFNVYYVF